MKLVKSPLCQWCGSTEIWLVPVNSLVNLKLGLKELYQKLWQRQGWPTNLELCWVCKRNCELVYQGISIWLCPECRKCFAFHGKRKAEKLAYNLLPANCFECGWQKKRLSKKEQGKIIEQIIKSGLVYQQKGYLASCSFCAGKIIGKQKDKGVKNRNKLGFWTDKISEDRLICNGCLRENTEFLKLLLGKYKKRWWAYKVRGMI